MSDKYRMEEFIPQIKNATKAEPELIAQTKKTVEAQMINKNKKNKLGFGKKERCIVGVAAIVILCIGGVMYDTDSKTIKTSDKPEKVKTDDEAAGIEDEVYIVDEIDDIELVGKSGKELLSLVHIEKAKDIAKIVIRQNELSYVSWTGEVIEDVEITNEQDISNFYTQLSELEIVQNNPVTTDESEITAPENAMNEPKEREILLYLSDGTYERLHYSPLSGGLLECFEIDGKSLERQPFQTISEDFNQWLIKLCRIDVEKDYTKEYEQWKIIQTYCIIVQRFEKEDWYGGFEEVFDEGILKIKVFLCENTKENRDTVLKILKNKENILFETTTASYKQLGEIKEYISEQTLSKHHDKYSYVIGCGVTSKEVLVDMRKDVTQEQIHEFLEDFSEYREHIRINVIEGYQDQDE